MYNFWVECDFSHVPPLAYIVQAHLNLCNLDKSWPSVLLDPTEKYWHDPQINYATVADILCKYGFKGKLWVMDRDVLTLDEADQLNNYPAIIIDPDVPWNTEFLALDNKTKHSTALDLYRHYCDIAKAFGLHSVPPPTEQILNTITQYCLDPQIVNTVLQLHKDSVNVH